MSAVRIRASSSERSQVRSRNGYISMASSIHSIFPIRSLTRSSNPILVRSAFVTTRIRTVFDFPARIHCSHSSISPSRTHIEIGNLSLYFFQASIELTPISYLSHFAVGSDPFNHTRVLESRQTEPSDLIRRIGAPVFGCLAIILYKLSG